MSITHAGSYEPYLLDHPQPPEEEGLRFGIGFIAFSLVCGLVALVLLLSGDRRIVLGVTAFWAVSIVLASPRAGVVLTLSTVVWDLVLNPPEGSAYVWISPGRVLSVLTVASYWIRAIGPGRLRIESPWARRAVIAFGAFTAWCLFSATWSIDQGTTMFTFLKVLIQFAFLVVAVDTLSSGKLVRQTLVLMAIGSAAGALAILLVPGLATLQASDTRTQFAGAGANAVAITLGTAAVGCFGLLPLRRSLLIIGLALVASVPMLLATFRAGTRSALVGVPVAAAFGAILAYWKKLGRLSILLIVVGGLSGGSFYWAVEQGFITGKLRERLLSAFESDTYETNVRLPLWARALDVYTEHPLGAGAGNEPLLVEQTRGGYGAVESHNTFVSVLLEYNVVGLLLFTAALFFLGWGILRIRERGLRATAAMLFAFCMLSIMKGSSQDTRLFWQPISLAAVFVEADARRRRSAEIPEWNTA